MPNANNIELKELVQRYEEMLTQGTELFFDVEHFEMLADYFYEQEKLDKTMRLVRMAIRQHPFSLFFPLRAAQIQLDLNHLNEAKNWLEKADSLEPENPDLIMSWAEWNSRKGKHNRAIQLLKKAAIVLGSSEEVNYMLAQEYMEIADYKSAAESFKKVLIADPEDSSALYSMSFCYDMLENNDQLIDFLKEFIDQNPYSEIAWHQLGLLYQKNKNYKKAIEAFDFARLIDDYFAAAYYEMARAYEMLEDYDRAIEIYNELLEIEDFNAYAYMRIGLAYREMGNNKQALRYLTKAYKDDPELEDTLLNLASLHEELGNFREALHFVKLLVKVDESQAFKLYSALLHHKSGLTDEALEMLQAMINGANPQPEAHLLYCELLFETEDFDDGIDLLYIAMEKFPDNADVPLRLGMVLFQISEIDEALIYLKQAAEMNPGTFTLFLENFPEIAEDPALAELVLKYKIK